MNSKKLFELQTRLVEKAGPAGYERQCGQLIAEFCKPYVDDVHTDVMGNIIAHRRGPGKKLLVSAHMDVIGLMVTYIDEKGFIFFDTIGGIRPSLVAYTPVRAIRSGVRGTIAINGSYQPEKAFAPKVTDLYIDIGASTKKDAQQLAAVGDLFVFDGSPRLGANEDILITPYADNLIGCCTLIMAMEAVSLSEPKNDIYYVFTAQEEFSSICRGAVASAYNIAPDWALNCDVTATGDTPNPQNKMDVGIGLGPTIKIKDASLICHPDAIELLRATAKKSGVPYQDEVLPFGGTDASAIQLSRGGVVAGSISIPTRHVHTPCEIVSIGDVLHGAKLMAAVLSNPV